VAADNAGSIRVLEKCGFTLVGKDRGYAHARGEEIDEWVMRLAG
jgi:RimJ/RimL family protein N-acetyltransferase